MNLVFSWKFVITSYSIHYTKLYDYGQIREDLFLIDSASGVIKKLAFDGIEEITSYAWSPVGNWLAIVGRETEENRITSYNVCYTKLLRTRAGPSRRF